MLKKEVCRNVENRCEQMLIISDISLKINILNKE